MMQDQALMQRIEINPHKLCGKPVIRGTRIAVEQILNILAAGVPAEEIKKDFPALTTEDVRAAVHYASKLMEDFHVYPNQYLAQIELSPA